MIHIVVLGKDYFPDKLKNETSKDRVVVIASASDSIPVLAYQNEIFRNMEVKLLPEIKNVSSAEGKNALHIAQAILIGQLIASEKDFEIYTDDSVLLSALIPFTGKKAPAKKSAKKVAPKKVEVTAPSPAVEEPAANQKKSSEKKTRKASEKKPKERKSQVKEVKAEKPKKEAFTSKIKEVAKTESKAPKESTKKAAVKLPTLAQVKSVVGAANSVRKPLKKEKAMTKKQLIKALNDDLASLEKSK